MALRDIINFQGCPTASQSASAYKAPLLGTPFLMSGANNTIAANYNSVDLGNGEVGGRWFKYAMAFTAGSATSQVKRLGIIWPVANLYGSPAGKNVFFGDRLKKYYSETGSSLSTALLTLYDFTLTDGVNPTTSNSTVLVSEADIASFSMTTAYWLEVQLDLPNNKIRVWIENTLLTETTIPAWLSTDPSKLAVAWGTPAANTVVARLQGELTLRDVYYKEVSDANDNYRLGPQTVYPLTVNTATATNWSTSNSAPIKDVLSTAVSALADVNTPYTQSDTGGNQLKLTYVVPALTRINGLGFMGGGARPVGVVANIAVKLSDATQSSPDKAVTIPGTSVTLGLNLGCFDKTPSGAQLSGAAIQAMTLTVTPTS